MHQVVFVAAAAAACFVTLALFVRALVFQKSSSEATLRSEVEALRAEYRSLLAQRAEGSVSEEVFEREENDLAARVLTAAAAAREADPRSARWLSQSAAVLLCIAIPVACASLYLWKGDYSALSPEAVEQVEMQKTLAQTERDFAETIAELEKNVKDPRHKDDLSAWEILADYYYNNQDVHKAENAYREVLRLDQANVTALVNLADVLVALNQGELSAEVADLTERALALDPWQDKPLLLGGVIAFQKGDWTKAAVLWGRLRKQTADGTELAEVLDHNLKAVMESGGFREPPHDPVGDKPAPDMSRRIMPPEGSQDAAARP